MTYNGAESNSTENVQTTGSPDKSVGPAIFQAFVSNYGNTVPIQLVTGSMENLLKEAGISRASAYRAFSNKGNIEEYLLEQLSLRDFYRTKTVMERAHGVLDWVASTTERSPGDRNRLIGTLGATCVSIPEFTNLTNLEHAVAPLPADSAVLAAIASNLGSSKAHHITVLSQLLGAAHQIFDETVPDARSSEGVFAYASNFHALARGLGTTSLDGFPPTLRDQLFVSVADHYAQPAQP